MAKLIFFAAAEGDYFESLTWYAERSVDASNDFDVEFDRAWHRLHPILNAFNCAMFDTALFFCDAFPFA